MIHALLARLMLVRLSQARKSFVLTGLYLLAWTSSPIAALPEILLSPRATTVHVGDSALFDVFAEGATTYKWYVNGVETPSQGDTLVLHSVKLTDDRSRIRCLVENSSGVRFTEEAVLRVIRPTREMLTFTGFLSDLSGVAVGSQGEAVQDMVIELYSAASGGVLLYQEVFLQDEGRGVPVQDGRFLARLGTGRISVGSLADAIQSGPNVHAQFRLGNLQESEALEPRVPLTSMPYAFSSSTSQLKGSGTPTSIGLEAPIGSTYLDTKTSKIWLRSFRNWVEVP